MVAPVSARKPGELKYDPSASSIPNKSLQDRVATSSNPKRNHLVTTTAYGPEEKSSHVETHIVRPDHTTARLSRINLLDLPVEVVESICRDYLDVCSSTCFGLTCKTIFNMTEHINPFQVNLHMRTDGICLGHLLTTWMEPKYSFNHSWGKFLLKKHYRNDDAEVERKWVEKEQWKRIRLSMDKLGASVAYPTKCNFRGGY